MGVVGFLQFSLNCVELFAWPIFALAYPLFASIRAIETNSNYHMKKLVTYWIMFSLISLFELTFVNLLEWFTIWPYMKILAIFWLVVPRFGHAYNAYKSIIQMRSNVNMQAFVNWLIKQDKVNFVETEETYLSVVKNFVKENGSEALEELISNKSKGTKTSLNDAKLKTGVTITEKKEMATTIESKGTKTSLNDAKLKTGVTITEKKEMATTIEAKQSNAKLAETERKIAKSVEMKETNNIPTTTTPPPSSSSDKVQKHWTCAVCQVTTSSQTTLNSHLQGQKHIAKCAELKAAKKQNPKNKNHSSSTTSKSGVPNQNANKSSSGDRVNQNKSTKQHEKKHRCSVCNVNCTGEIDFDSHLKGKKHLSMVQEMVSSLSGLQP